MSEIATTAAEALDLLNAKTGGIEYWLGDEAAQLITDACDVLPIVIADEVFGPADVVGFSLTGPYKWPAGFLNLTMGTGSVTIEVYDGQRMSEALSRLLGQIEMELPGLKGETSPLQAYGGFQVNLRRVDGSLVEMVGISWTPA